MSNHLSPPRIVCAAIRLTFTLWELPGQLFSRVIIGPRHCDSVMQEHNELLRFRLKGSKQITFIDNEEGFIDQHGKFYNRQEAWKIAEANGQIIRRCGADTANGGTLYSENLY